MCNIIVITSRLFIVVLWYQFLGIKLKKKNLKYCFFHINLHLTEFNLMLGLPPLQALLANRLKCSRLSDSVVGCSARKYF